MSDGSGVEDRGLGDEELVGMGRVVPSGPGPEGAPDLTASYLGMQLCTPVVASSSPMTGHLSSLEALEEAGVGAVVLPSLFEEQLEHEAAEVERYFGVASGVNPEATFGYTPILDDYNLGSARYLGTLREAKDLLGVPVIASLNGVTRGGWTEYARMLAHAGADAIELNVYRVAADPLVSGRQVETDTLELVEAVVDACDVPVAVKLSPYWSALGSFAGQLVDAGASGLVLFNRFYQPDIELETLSVGSELDLSKQAELRLPLRWMAALYGRVEASLAATTGVHAPTDVVKVLLAGANVAMSTSALLMRGPGYARTLVDGLRSWMEERGYASVRQMIGSVSQQAVANPAEFERAHYLDTLVRSAGSFVA